MPRTASFDYARLLAAFGIVLFHTGAPGAAIGYAALPFFLILMIVMGARASTVQPWHLYSIQRVHRLITPWLIWSAVYALLKLGEVALTSATLGSEFAPFMVLTGPALHLWFLPFACAVCILAWPLVRIGSRHPEMVAGICIVTSLLLLAVRQTMVIEAPFAQWLYAAPAVTLGVALALYRDAPRPCLTIVGIFTLVALSAGWTSGLGQLVLAGAGVVACQLWHIPVTPLSKRCANSALGVYLAHPLVISVLERTTPLSPETLGLAGLAAGCTLALVVVWHYRPFPKGAISPRTA